MKEFANILVVTRAGVPCRKAVHCGYSLSRRYKSALTLLHLVDQDPFELGGGPIPDTIEHDYDVYLAEARGVMDQVAAPEEGRTAATRLVRYGDTAEQVERLVSEEGFDLVVMPAQPEGRWENFLKDRSRGQLLRDLPCSVLLVKEE